MASYECAVAAARRVVDDHARQPSASRSLWVASQPVAGLAAEVAVLPPGKARTRLGAEHDLVVIDAVSPGEGLDPDALGALSGTLVAGGLLVLLLPDNGGRAPDADYRRLADHPRPWESLSSRFLERLHRRLGTLDAVLTWHPGEGTVDVPGKPAGVAGASAVATPSRQRQPGLDADCLSADQAEAVARLVRLRRRRPLVITADRGRGKSAALGIACVRWLARGEADGDAVDIVLTAPRASSVDAVFERLVALRPAARRDGLTLTDPGGRVRFVAPDVLSQGVAEHEEGGAGSLLLVDEAAAIPAALLATWLGAFPRIAFATTVHGYEGSGRGFALRFRAVLDRLTPDWKALHLTTPIRWASGDPLEAATADLLLLDAQVGAPSHEQTDADVGDGLIRTLDRDALSRDETRLRGVFGLLVQAHYRTTPADLRALLDAPATRILELADAAAPRAMTGVLVSTDEGGFDVELAERVARGERRPRGHLLAQSLAAHAGEPEALTAQLRRVTRLAVHPDLRRRGLGARLLNEGIAAASADGRDLFGASFGADGGLLAFWRAQGFAVVRLGLTREAATGEHAVMVARATSERGVALLWRLRQRFARQLPALLAFELNDLAPDVLVMLLAETATHPAGTEPAPGDIPLETALSSSDLRDLHAMAHGARDPALVRPAIQALVQWGAVSGRLGPNGAVSGRLGPSGAVSGRLTQTTGAADAALGLAAWAWQGRDMEHLARSLGLSGRRQVLEALRSAVAQLLA
ncbi:GNAT family N-acetyltransferase [Halomonas sp. V046]|uniref:GNAT family N-acetyltransferase n=1 Tax=Halomonas sp. V046 TaxID=3459611 RepID=UPI004044733B